MISHRFIDRLQPHRTNNGLFRRLGLFANKPSYSFLKLKHFVMISHRFIDRDRARQQAIEEGFDRVPFLHRHHHQIHIVWRRRLSKSYLLSGNFLVPSHVQSRI